MAFLKYNRILEIDMIQRRSNKQYKEAKYDWKRERESYFV